MQAETQSSGVTTHAHAGNCDDAAYEAFLARIQARFMERTDNGKRPLFTTVASGVSEDVFEEYLRTFPADQRQFHNCNACRRFINRYGLLVVIDEDGRAVSAMWDEQDSPEEYKRAVQWFVSILRNASITGPFYAEEGTWGTPQTGQWVHMAVTPPKHIVHYDRTKSAFQLMAEKREDFNTVSRALGEFSLATVETAVSLLKSDALYQSEKVLGQAVWLQMLHTARHTTKNSSIKQNAVWLAVAKAPAGFCHPRSSMIGTLLEDIAAGKPFEEVARAFKAKMHPLAYQRPQAAPSAGTIAQAEKVFEQLGLASALRRRFARVDEIEAIWRPTPEQKVVHVKGTGIFAHLHQAEPKPASTMVVPAQVMTFEKFCKTVLPGARLIEIEVPTSSAAFAPFVTAADPDAQPIIQWDSSERRNPVTWYYHSCPTPASHWGLTAGWRPVTAISLQPNQWFGDERFAHHGKGALFAIEGARESKTADGGGLFPSHMRSELHGVRSVIEAHSKSAVIEGKEDGSACGLMFQSSRARWDVQLRVTGAVGQRVLVRLDRWD